jgi:hypothetical protein
MLMEAVSDTHAIFREPEDSTEQKRAMFPALRAVYVPFSKMKTQDTKHKTNGKRAMTENRTRA